jgi:hypothetical protein
MPETKKSFKTSDGIMDIPDSEIEGFLEAYPDAQEVKSFVAEKDTFDIPLDEVDGFLQAYPDAKPLSFSDPQKKNPVGSTVGSDGSIRDRETFLNTVVTLTQKRGANWTDSQWDAYADALKKNKSANFTDDEIGMIRSLQPKKANVKLAKEPTLTTPVEPVKKDEKGNVDLTDFVAKQEAYQKGLIGDTVYATPDAAEVAKQKITRKKELALIESENNAKAQVINKALQNPKYAAAADESELISWDNYNAKRTERYEQINSQIENEFKTTGDSLGTVYNEKMLNDPDFQAINNEILQKANQEMQPYKQQAQQLISSGADVNEVNAQLNAKYQELQKKYASQDPRLQELSDRYTRSLNEETKKIVAKKLLLQLNPEGELEITEKAFKPKPSVLSQQSLNYWKDVFSSPYFKSLNVDDKKQYVAKSWNYVEDALLAKGYKGEQLNSAKDSWMYNALYNTMNEVTTEGGVKGVSSLAIREFAEKTKSELEVVYKQQQEQMKSIFDSKWNDRSKAGISYALSTEMGRMKDAIDGLEKIMDAPEEAMGDFIDGMGARKGDMIPFLSGFMQLTGAADMYRISKKVENNERLTASEDAILKYNALNNQLSQTVTPSIWYKAGEATAQSLPFIGEFVATGGIFNVAKAGTQKAVTAALTRAIGEKASQKVAQNLLVKPLSFLIGAAAQTAANPQHYLTNTLERMSPELQFALSEEGEKVVAKLDFDTKVDQQGYKTGKNQDLPEALAKGFGETFVDNFTERFGDAAKVIGKFVPDKGKELMKRFALAAYMRKAGILPNEAVRDFMSKTVGWHGFGNEFFLEELPAMPLTNLITGEGPVMEGIIMEDADGNMHLDSQSLGVTALSVGAMTVFMGGAGSVAGHAIKRQQENKLHDVSFLDQNNNRVTAQIKNKNIIALQELKGKTYYEIAQWRKREFPKMDAEGNERYYIDMLAQGIQQQKIDATTNNARTRMQSRLSENSALSELNRIEQEALKKAAAEDPEVQALLDAAEEAEDYNVVIVKKEFLPWFGKRAYTEKALAGLEAKYKKGDRSEETTKRISQLRQELDVINSNIGQIRRATAAELAWMKKKEPAYYNDYVKDSEIIVMDKDGNIADQKTQDRVKNDIMPVLEKADELGTGTIEVKPAGTMGTEAQAAPAVTPTPLQTVVDGKTWVVDADGSYGTISRNDIGEYILTREDGSEKILPVSDKTNVTETLEDLGMKMPGELAPSKVKALKVLRWDAGMRKIDRILNRPDSRFNEVYNKMIEGEALTEEEKLDAITFLAESLDKIENTDTKEAEEKQRYIDLINSINDDFNAAKVKERPKPVAPAPAAAPTEEEAPKEPARKAMNFPDVSTPVRGSIIRLVGAKNDEAYNAVISAVKEAYETGKDPVQAIRDLGYVKETYTTAIKTIVEGLKPLGKKKAEVSVSEAIADIERRRQEELATIISLESTADNRRPNGSIGTQGFDPTQMRDLIKFLNEKLSLNIDKKLFEGEKLKPLIDFITDNKDLVEKIKQYVKTDPIEVSRMPDDSLSFRDGNHRANLLNLIGSDILPTIEVGQRNKVDEINAKYDAELAALQAPSAAGAYPKKKAPYTASELNDLSNIDVMEFLAEDYPQLAPLMKRGIAAFDKLTGAKAEGKNQDIDFPFPYRLASQLYFGKTETRSIEIDKALAQLESEIEVIEAQENEGKPSAPIAPGPVSPVSGINIFTPIVAAANRVAQAQDKGARAEARAELSELLSQDSKAKLIFDNIKSIHQQLSKLGENEFNKTSDCP